MKIRWGVAAFVPLLTLSSCAPWTVRPIDSNKSSGAAQTPSPAAYVDSIWSTKLVPLVLNSAVDTRTLLDAYLKSPQDAVARYGHREGKGPVYFLVKGEGRVTAVDTRSRVGLVLVDLPPFDQKPDISILVGPVLRGTALRDSTGLIRFTDFANQLQFADAGNAINDRVLRSVLASVDVGKLKGKRISFAGAVTADPHAMPPLRELMPVRLDVEDGK